MISHVLDTCALLDLISRGWANPAAVGALATARRPAILSVSVWEIARKVRTGKLTLPVKQPGVLRIIREICERYDLHLEPLTGEVCEAAELLPAHHEDPFDRMIIALATTSHCPLFTTDRKFDAYDVRVISHQ